MNLPRTSKSSLSIERASTAKFNSEPIPTRLESKSIVVLIAVFFLAINMYVDRAAVGQLKGDIGKELDLDSNQLGWFIGAFFWAYALGQVPAAILGLKVGLRGALTTFLVLWSIATIFTGLSYSFSFLIASRIALGLTEAGAYPNANALVRDWFPLQWRGRACSVITLGGRLGWAISQFLTPLIVVMTHSWRWVLILYGGFGILMALPFWFLARERNDRTNNRQVAGKSEIDPESAKCFRGSHPNDLVRVRELVSNRNVVLASMVQFFVNFGWVFLLSDLPMFLQTELRVEKVYAGFLASIPAFISCVGMVFGGLITDTLIRSLGLRWGRSIPISAMMFVSGIAYLLCGHFTNPITFVLTISIMAIATDISNPAIWAVSQDIGGKGAGKVLGWINMIGNFGAGISPVAIAWLKESFGWNANFTLFACMFFFASVLALGINCNRPLREGCNGGSKDGLL